MCWRRPNSFIVSRDLSGFHIQSLDYMQTHTQSTFRDDLKGEASGEMTENECKVVGVGTSSHLIVTRAHN